LIFAQVQFSPGDFCIEYRTFPNGDTEDDFRPSCGFILTRGPNKGNLCGKQGAESANGFVWFPACDRHLHNYMDSRTTIFEVNTVVSAETLLPISTTTERVHLRATWLTPAGVANERAQEVNRQVEMIRAFLERQRGGGERGSAQTEVETSGVLRRLDMARVPKAIERRLFCPVCIRGQEDFGEGSPPIFLLMPCGHTICKDCYEKIQSLKCGECRNPFEEKDLRAL
jgi:hypothetical protein